MVAEFEQISQLWSEDAGIRIISTRVGGAAMTLRDPSLEELTRNAGLIQTATGWSIQWRKSGFLNKALELRRYQENVKPKEVRTHKPNEASIC